MRERKNEKEGEINWKKERVKERVKERERESKREREREWKRERIGEKERERELNRVSEREWEREKDWKREREGTRIREWKRENGRGRRGEINGESELDNYRVLFIINSSLSFSNCSPWWLVLRDVIRPQCWDAQTDGDSQTSQRHLCPSDPLSFTRGMKRERERERENLNLKLIQRERESESQACLWMYSCIVHVSPLLTGLYTHSVSV